MGLASAIRSVRDSAEFDRVQLTATVTALDIPAGTTTAELAGFTSGTTLATITSHGGVGEVIKLKNGTGGSVTVDNAGSGASQDQFYFNTSAITDFTWADGTTLTLQRQASGAWQPFTTPNSAVQGTVDDIGTDIA